tara:strand:- start:2952 stop:3749 length:798 start_codon:yes stop_codon:yes gene_type:complete
MEIPYTYYFSIEGFNSNYQDDFELFRKKTGDNERLFLEFLLEKYQEIYGALERYEQHYIEFDNSNSSRKSLSEITGIRFNNSFSFKELGNYFNSKDEALNRFRNARIRYFEYHEIEYLITCFYSEENGVLSFDELGYLKHKIAFEEIINALEILKENLSEKVLSNDMDLIKKYIWSEKIEKFENHFNKFKDYYANNKTNKEVIYFLKYVVDNEYFISFINGKKIAPRHYKKFIAELLQMDLVPVENAYKEYFSKIKSNHYPSIFG